MPETGCGYLPCGRAQRQGAASSRFYPRYSEANKSNHTTVGAAKASPANIECIADTCASNQLHSRSARLALSPLLWRVGSAHALHQPKLALKPLDSCPEFPRIEFGGNSSGLCSPAHSGWLFSTSL